MYESQKKRLTIVLLFVFCMLLSVALNGLSTETIEQKNKYGGKTLQTTYQTGIRYTNEENLRFKQEYFDSDNVLRQVDGMLVDGNLYRIYNDESGAIQRKEWENPSREVYSSEYYRNGKVTRIVWYQAPDVVESITFFDEDSVISKVERFPADSPMQIEHYRPDKSVKMVELFSEDSVKTERVFFNEDEKENRREYLSPDGSLHRVSVFDARGRLIQAEYYSRNGRKTVEHFEKDRLTRKEVFDRKGNPDKVSYFDRDGSMTRAEIYDRKGKLSFIRHYNTDKKKTKEEIFREDGTKVVEHLKDDRCIKREYYSPTGALLKTENCE